jgi:hypothetical protein
VKTERLCEGSDEQSRRLTPFTARTARAMDSTISNRRPSLTFGTHSTRCIGLQTANEQIVEWECYNLRVLVQPIHV